MLAYAFGALVIILMVGFAIKRRNRKKLPKNPTDWYELKDNGRGGQAPRSDD